jgi:hypothetical protein
MRYHDVMDYGAIWIPQAIQITRIDRNICLQNQPKRMHRMNVPSDVLWNC